MKTTPISTISMRRAISESLVKSPGCISNDYNCDICHSFVEFCHYSHPEPANKIYDVGGKDIERNIDLLKSLRTLRSDLKQFVS